jgi:hypothetical protein
LAVGIIVTACLARAAAAAQTLPASLQACAQERDDSRRLRCYDREMARYVTAPEQTFGLSQQQVRKVQHLEQKDSGKPVSLTAKVVRLTQRRYGEFVVTLDNDQVWLQVAGEGTVLLNVGDTVTLKPGLLGSYFLITPAGSATRVKRAQ